MEIKKYRGAVAVVYLCMFLEGAGNILIASTKSSLMEHFGISLAAIGTILMVDSIACGLFPMVTGSLSDKFGRKIVIFSGTILFSIFFICVPLIKQYPLLILLTFIRGLGYCGTDPSSQATLFDAYEDAAPKMPMVQLAFATGSFTAPIIISYIYDNNIDWQFSYYLYGALFLMLMVFVATREFPPFAKDRVTTSVPKYVFKRDPKPLREGLALCLYMAPLSLGYGFISRWVDVYMIDVFTFTNSDAVRVLSIYQIGCMLGAFINIFLTRKFHATLLLISHTVIGLVFSAIAILSMNSNVFIAGFFVVGAALGSLFSLCVGLLGQFFPKNAGAATGIFASTSSICLALSSLIAGKSVGVIGIYPLFVSILFLLALSISIALVIRKMYVSLLVETVSV